MTSHDSMVYWLTLSQTMTHSSLPSSSSVCSNSTKSKETSSSHFIPNQMSKSNESTRFSNNTYAFSVTISKMTDTIYFPLLNSPTTTPNIPLRKSSPST